jgi:hypothetical protein
VTLDLCGDDVARLPDAFQLAFQSAATLVLLQQQHVERGFEPARCEGLIVLLARPSALIAGRVPKAAERR